MNPASPTPETPTAPLTLAEQIRGILTASAKPMTMAQIKTALGKLPPKGTKKDPKPPIPLDGDILRELNAELAAKRAFEHPDGKYGKNAPPVVKSLLEVMEESVRAKLAGLADLGDGPFAGTKLGKPTAAKGAAAMQAFEAVVAKLVAEGKLFEHPGEKYGRVAPPVVKSLIELMEQSVEKKLADLGENLATASQLGQPKLGKGASATPAFEEKQQAFAEVVKKLVADGRLYEHPGGKYGLKPPLKKPEPKWYTVSPHKTAFNAIMTNVGKILAGGIAPEQLLAALRTHPKLAEAGPGLIDPPVAPKPEPAPKPHPELKPPIAPPADLRIELKKAYDHLCRFIPSRMIELRALYPQLIKAVPGLLVSEFHRTLWAMHNDRILELHVLNEVHLAEDKHLAIDRNEHLYYYAIWR